MTRARIAPWLAVVLAAAWSPNATFCERRQTAPPTASVHLKFLFPPRGEDLGAAKVIQFVGQDGSDLAARFHDNAASAIPYGQYRLRAAVAGFWPDERNVVVYQPEVWVVVGLQLAMGWEEGGGPLLLRGRIEHMPPESSDVWVRMTGLYSSFIGDSRVDRLGNFAMSSPRDDRWVLVVREGKNVLYTAVVNVTPDRQLHIDLAADPGSRTR